MLDLVECNTGRRTERRKNAEQRLLIEPMGTPRRLTARTDLLFDILSAESLLQTYGPACPGMQWILGDGSEGGSSSFTGGPIKLLFSVKAL
jgi:hypothetical protein